MTTDREAINLAANLRADRKRDDIFPDLPMAGRCYRPGATYSERQAEIANRPLPERDLNPPSEG